MRFEMADGVLSFYINYDLFVSQKGQADPMETLETDASLKG